VTDEYHLKDKLVEVANGTISANIFKRKMALAIQLKWIFLALKWAVSCLKNCVQFFQESNRQVIPSCVSLPFVYM